MVSVDYNKNWWGRDYDWAESGDEWSAPWGGAEAQWFGSLLPRIHRYLPAGEVVEIASGFGRWTQFLKDQSGHLTGVDISDVCIDACKERFKDEPNLDFVLNDGTTFPGIANQSVDFVFSYDSLVHADRATIAGYLTEFRRTLKPGGVAFIHHSNLGSYARRLAPLRKIPHSVGALQHLHVMDYHHGRDPGVSAKFVEQAALDAGLRCISQEVITWITKHTLLDCISVIVPEESPAKHENVVLRNRQFTKEPAYIAQVAAAHQPS